MPAVSRWMIKLSFIYLLAGMLLGALIFIQKAYTLHPVVWSFLPVHIEFLLFGWIVQFTLGTAYWILPRHLTGPPRGSKLPATAMVLLLNAGILVIAAGSLQSGTELLGIIGRLVQLMAVALFAWLMWTRITTYRKKK